MRNPFLLVLGMFGAVYLAGCASVANVPVTVVPTRTPGVTFVIVRPIVPPLGDKHRTQLGDSKQVDPNSQYILLCDARPVDGMHCSVPTEAALARYSYTPITGNAEAPIDEGVGTLADLSTHVSKDKDETPAAETAAPAAQPPQPPPTAPKEGK